MSVQPIEPAQLPTELQTAAQAVRAKLPTELQNPKWGIICGSGLGGLADSLVNMVAVPYHQIPGFPQTTVEGHKSILAFGFLEQDGKRIPVVACLGRFHGYEGFAPQEVVFPTRLFRALGAQAVLVTNAAGGINPNYQVGTIVAIHDHISFPGLTGGGPLVGPNVSVFGPRFPPMSNAYDIPLRLAVFKAANALGMPEQDLQQGTYVHVSGPTYESRAESRFLRQIGGDAVGMSTVPEVVAAHHSGMRVLALSLITNKVVVDDYLDARQALAQPEAVQNAQAAKDKAAAANHEEVMEVGRRKAEEMRRLVQTVITQTEL